VNDHGFFMLVDPQTNMIVAGERFDMTETEVIEYCRQSPILCSSLHATHEQCERKNIAKLLRSLHIAAT
jgi:hypothetical protein